MFALSSLVFSAVVALVTSVAKLVDKVVSAPVALVISAVKAVFTIVVRSSTYVLLVRSLLEVGASVTVTFVPVGKAKLPNIVLPDS